MQRAKIQLSIPFLFTIFFALPAFSLQPEMVISVTEFDFGVVNEGAVINHDFTVKNVGDADLRIERVVAGCSCIATDVPTAPILPGETATISIQLKTAGLRGSVQREMVVFTNESVRSDDTFILKGVVVPKVSVVPAYLNWGSVIKGERLPPPQKVTVSIREGENIKIGAIKSFSKGLVVEGIQGSETQKTFFVSLSEDIKIGELRDRVVIALNGGRSVNLPSFAVVKNALELSRKTLSLGAINVAAGVIVKKIYLKNNGDTPVSITDLDSDSSAIKAAYRTLIPGKEYEITVMIDPKRIKKELRGALNIETDSELQPELTLGVFGYLRKNKR